VADAYITEVNRGDLNMGSLERSLNDKHKDGYKLAHIFEQGGNTIMIFERVGQAS
jgi:hypothetical protein